MRNYIVINDDDFDNLINRVNKYIEDFGYVPIGGIQLFPERGYCQTLYKKSPSLLKRFFSAID